MTVLTQLFIPSSQAAGALARSLGAKLVLLLLAASCLGVAHADDEVVRPVDTVALDGASNVLLQDICANADVAHSGLVTQPLPLAVITRAVAPEPWTSPGPDACPANGS